MGSDVKYIELSKLLSVPARNGLYKGKEFQGSGHRWIKMSEVFGYSFFEDQTTEMLDVTESEINRFSCLPGDLLFGRTSLILEGVGDCLLVENVKDLPIFESNLFRLRFDHTKACPRFYFYYFQSRLGKQLIQKIAKQTAATSITASDLIEQPVPYFDINVAKRISDLTFKFDQKIQLNRQTNQTLEQMAQALFKSWFVDFDPVIDNALAAGNPIPPELEQKAAQRAQVRAAAKVSQAKPDAHPHHHASELPQHLRELFPSEFEHTEALGWVPKGWEAGTVGNCFDVTMGQSPPGSTYNENGEGLPFFQGKTDYGFRFPTNRIYCTEPKRVANKSDTLISVRAPVGDVNMALDKCILGRGVAAARHKSGSISYTYYSMKQLEGHFKVFESEGTVFGSINQKDFKALAVIKPCEEVTDIFERLAKSFDEKIEAGTYSINELTKLRDTLLPKLISGELRLPEAETDAPSLTDEASV